MDLQRGAPRIQQRRLATSTLARQLVPPSIERKDRICPFELRYGMITVPLGRTTGFPPRPAAPSLLARDGPQVSRSRAGPARVAPRCPGGSDHAGPGQVSKQTAQFIGMMSKTLPAGAKVVLKSVDRTAAS